MFLFGIINYKVSNNYWLDSPPPPMSPPPVKPSQAYPRSYWTCPDNLEPPAVAASSPGQTTDLITAFPSFLLSYSEQSRVPSPHLTSPHLTPSLLPHVSPSLSYCHCFYWSPAGLGDISTPGSQCADHKHFLGPNTGLRPGPFRQQNGEINTFRLVSSWAQEDSGMSSSILTTIFVYSPLLFNLRHSPGFTKINQRL